jgi:mannan endo-1,4-beta-mannosidase
MIACSTYCRPLKAWLCLRFFITVSLLSTWIMSRSQNGFVQSQNTQFFIDNQPYSFLGANLWFGMNLGSAGAGGDRHRLVRELDRLQALGINNLRIMAASEGPDDSPWRISPTLQTAPGIYNEQLWEGLDCLLHEMGQRKMYAVVCLNNFWPWSGGMAQYLSWQTGETIPYPPPAPNGSWHEYMSYSAGFYRNEAASQAYENFLREIILRVNSINQIAYKDDPTIMAWQLANEPRGMRQGEAYFRWIKRSAQLIKQLDPHHLVSVGSEGHTSVKAFANNRFKEIHQLPEIDYLTCHIWVQNWLWYQPKAHRRTYGRAKRKVRSYLKTHQRIAKKLDKPLVLEEFGMARDRNDHAPEAGTVHRDEYFDFVFGLVAESIQKGHGLVGCNFWAWAGEGRPREARAIWQAGDDFIGDPPHEHQGWYSVYDTDEPTLKVIRKWAIGEER